MNGEYDYGFEGEMPYRRESVERSIEGGQMLGPEAEVAFARFKEAVMKACRDFYQETGLTVRVEVTVD